MGSLKEEYDLEAEEWRVRRMGAAQRYFHKTYCRILHEGRGDLAVDLGCGGGKYTLGLAKKYKNVIGVDFSKNMLKVFDRSAKRFQNVSSIKADVAKLPFDDGSVDLVIAMGLTEFFDDVGPMLSEIKWVL